MENNSLNIIYTLQSHPFIRILLHFLPNEIVSLIAIQYKAIIPYPLYLSKNQLFANCIQWVRQIRNDTIYSIFYYRRNNNMTEQAFRFPRENVPCINRTFRICHTRESQLKYQSLWQRELISNYNIPFLEIHRTMILTMFIQLFNYETYIIEILQKKEFIEDKKLDELVRAYYRFDMDEFLKYTSFSKYINTIIYPWK